MSAAIFTRAYPREQLVVEHTRRFLWDHDQRFVGTTPTLVEYKKNEVIVFLIRKVEEDTYFVAERNGWAFSESVFLKLTEEGRLIAANE